VDVVGDLAAGALTFLFTDLEGSTRLWEELPDVMAGALARHDALLADVIAAAGGTVFKRTGDGLHAVFADPAAALRAAVDLQRAVATEPWGDVGPLRIRIALHSGAAQLRAGDYFGPTLNRAARVLGVGHGGQIVATAATIGFLPDTPVLDLGLHRLRDLAEPVHLYQIEVPGLATQFHRSARSSASATTCRCNDQRSSGGNVKSIRCVAFSSAGVFSRSPASGAAARRAWRLPWGRRRSTTSPTAFSSWIFPSSRTGASYGTA
jgi:class 3 adenylate cyclase